MTPEEYLAWEAASDTRHEYAEGVVIAMAGVGAVLALPPLNLQLALHEVYRQATLT
jgi:hypothetical protein